MVLGCLALFALASWNLNVYIMTPGDATPVAPLISVSGVAHEAARSTILLTDVYLQGATGLSWLTSHFDPHAVLINGSALTDPGVPLDELNAQSFLDMATSKENARVAAFTSLGWTIPVTLVGAAVQAVIVPSPARSAGVNVADQVTSINGQVIHQSCDAISALHRVAPGTRVALSIRPARFSPVGEISYGPVTTKSVVTVPAPSTVAASDCPGVSGRATSWIGVSLSTALHYSFPATVSIATPNIGGPSAGLAMALTIIDQLTPGSLTNRQLIAATGTIDPNGLVGDVGGVAQKTIAVERAGASLFVVPSGEYAEARAASNGRLRVVGVDTLSQAISAIRGKSPIPAPLAKP